MAQSSVYTRVLSLVSSAEDGAGKAVMRGPFWLADSVQLTGAFEATDAPTLVRRADGEFRDVRFLSGNPRELSDVFQFCGNRPSYRSCDLCFFQMGTSLLTVYPRVWLNHV
jgi:hypothetical protein